MERFRGMGTCPLWDRIAPGVTQGAIMVVARRIGAVMLIFTGLYFMGSVATSIAQEGKKADAKTPYVRPKWNDKEIAFEMRAKPWATVFEWFSDQTGMPFSSQYAPPSGTFTFINPKI